MTETTKQLVELLKKIDSLDNWEDLTSEEAVIIILSKSIYMDAFARWPLLFGGRVG